MKRNKALLLFGVLLVGLLFSVQVGLAVPDAPGVVIDDFEDGDASDWSFFGGNAAGNDFQ